MWLLSLREGMLPQPWVEARTETLEVAWPDLESELAGLARWEQMAAAGVRGLAVFALILLAWQRRRWSNQQLQNHQRQRRGIPERSEGMNGCDGSSAADAADAVDAVADAVVVFAGTAAVAASPAGGTAAIAAAAVANTSQVSEAADAASAAVVGD